MLHILLRVIAARLRKGSAAGAQARFRAVSSIHRFGASLNRHIHCRCCIIDGG
ncbi:transposase [uncultured Thiohalocapsa sp.]|uniref:transposase n=1 Tax=uncultured Thiohalocapsa sp. TaxID=768990 RepID=UPI0025E14CCA|nr:transposase [uncultured Thiohalocapsa sp.]